MQQRRNNRHNNNGTGNGNNQMRRNNQNNRGRNNNNNNRNNGGNNNANRPRINVKQCMDKRDSYLNKARDILNSDRVMAEYYWQHADHYQRLINEYNEEQELRRAEFETTQEFEEDTTDAVDEGFDGEPRMASADAEGDVPMADRAEDAAVAPMRNRRERPSTPRVAAQKAADAAEESAPDMQNAQDADQPAPRRRGRPRVAKADQAELPMGEDAGDQANVIPIGLPGAIG